MWLLLLILWAIAELFVAFEVAKAIGFLLMVLLIIASWPIGSWAMRSQGRVAMRHLREALAAGRPPAGSMLEGVLVVAGGLLLNIPGFITDAFGLLLLFPPTRALASRVAARRLGKRGFGPGGRFGRGGGPARQDYDVEGTAADIDGDKPRLST
jgi:UPF0716 protein FxsA